MNLKSQWGPIAELIIQANEADSYEDKEALLNQLMQMQQEFSKTIDSFENRFNEILNANSRLEEKNKELDRLLDEMADQISEGDYEISRIEAQDLYKTSWNELDEYSKKYLIMANHLYKVSKKDDIDFSPAALEYGRALENEFLRRLYNDFVVSLGDTKEIVEDEEPPEDYEPLRDAVMNCMEGRVFYLPARKMVKYLKQITWTMDPNPYISGLEAYIDAKEYLNKVQLTDKHFLYTADAVFKNYRNRAAHPGTVLAMEDGSDCQKKTQETLEFFIQATCGTK